MKQAIRFISAMVTFFILLAVDNVMVESEATYGLIFRGIVCLLAIYNILVMAASAEQMININA